VNDKTLLPLLDYIPHDTSDISPCPVNANEVKATGHTHYKDATHTAYNDRRQENHYNPHSASAA